MNFIYPEDIRHHFVEGGVVENFDEQIQKYEEYIARQFESIQRWIPDSVSSVLDIGCGLGGINIPLCHAFPSVKRIKLIDGDGTGERKMSYNLDTTAWMDRKIAVSFVRANVDSVIVSEYPPDKAYVPAELMISIKSCGHHYPVDVYIPLMKKSLYKTKRVILDIRRKTNGVETMEENGFRMIGQCYETNKHKRIIFEL